jgi:hypothetical protein
LTIDSLTKAKVAANGAIEASGSASANAISFLVPGQIVDVGGDPGQIRLTAQGGIAGGSGGFMFIDAIAIAHTKRSVDASALSGDGLGGSITFTNLTTLGTIPPKNAFQARGMGMGEGGRLIVQSLQSNLDINYNVDVKGGDNLTTNSGLDGFISLNSTACQAYRLSGADYPRGYWNCINTTTPANDDRHSFDLVDSLTQMAKSSLKDAGAEIYLFTSNTPMNQFHGQSQQGLVAGYTLRDCRRRPFTSTSSRR